jgi:multidrug resistance efflux pump
MAKNQKNESAAGEQLDLIEVAPENAKKIVAVARKYKSAQAERLAALEVEVAEKQNLLELVRQAKLPLVDGKIKFKTDGYIITVTPRDELVKVKNEGEQE